MNFLKLLDLNVVFYSILGTALLITYLSKEDEIKTLKDEKIAILKKLDLANDNLKKCDAKVDEQNKKIEDMKVEVTYIEPKSIEKVKNVFIKDSTCESELKAYKELFNE